MEEAYNLECTETGLAPYSEITLLHEYSIDWPFPWLRGSNGKMLTIEKMSETTGMLESWDGTDSTYIRDITFPSFTMQDIPDLATFDTYRVLTGTFGVLDGIGDDLEPTNKIPKSRTCCNFKGQLILGGILDSWHGCDETFIAHSNIGDVTMEPDWKNEAGFRPMKFCGNVWRVRRLGDLVAVYGSEGVAFLAPVQAPAPTFGAKEISKIKMANPAAADGGEEWHIVVDKDKALWRISQDGVEKLGYRESLESMVTEEIVVSYDSANDRVYIADTNRSLIMTKWGLTRCHQAPLGVANYYSQSYFVGWEEAVDGFALAVGPFDFGYNSLKTVYTVESDQGEEVMVQVPVNGSFQAVKTVPLNDVGVSTPIVSGQSFIIVVRDLDSREGVYPNHILLRWKMSDLRGMRGYYRPRES